MAKIDTSKIEGYADMSAEDKLKALESFEYDDNLSELERYKNATSKANSEAAEWKRKHNALLSEEEAKKQESAEALEAMKNELEELRKEKTLSKHTASFLSLGYDEKLAQETAEALTNGELDKVFANQKIFLEAHDKQYAASLMGSVGKPPAGASAPEMTLEKFRKLPASERATYAAEHPEEYKALYEGEN